MSKIEKRLTRKKRIRAKVKGDSQKPRLNVFRSNLHLFAQLIDDVKGKTLVSANDTELKKGKGDKIAKTKVSSQVGELIAQKALAKKISEVVFDRNGYKYHGRIKEFADGARKGGLKF